MVAVALMCCAGPAVAQKPLPPIDPLPPTEGPPVTSTPAPAPAPAAPTTPPGPGLAATEAEAEAGIDIEAQPRATHAPKNAFYVGARLGLLGYGGKFFVNERSAEETSGNFIGPGASVEVNVGARLNRRYIPYLLVEVAAHQAGHRFDKDTESMSRLVGLGFRFVLGNVDRAGFLADLSIAQRTISVTRDGQTFRMHGPEIFRLGLGAEIRLSNVITLSPMGHISGGSMAQSDGDIAYAQPQTDGQTHPTFLEGNVSKSQRAYLVIGIGCGAHFDLFGK